MRPEDRVIDGVSQQEQRRLEALRRWLHLQGRPDHHGRRWLPEWLKNIFSWGSHTRRMESDYFGQFYHDNDEE